jgi:hypothetical protein
LRSSASRNGFQAFVVTAQVAVVYGIEHVVTVLAASLAWYMAWSA